ncbi:MAG: hypothetical protein K2Q03_10205 [Sphingobacteriaceae bacterium]|nr:hypothetical protein [Sphingobacteriaceae bacterium]
MKKIAILIVMFAMPFFVSAQAKHNEEIEALRVGYFTQKLDLSADDAKIFWSIFKEYQKEQMALRNFCMKDMIRYKKVEQIDELSDSEVSAMLQKESDFKQKDFNLERKYYTKFKNALNIKTVAKFYIAQESFKRELLKKYREKHRD